MKKKSGIFVDNLPSRFVKNSFLSVYRKFQKNKGEKSGNSKNLIGWYPFSEGWGGPESIRHLVI
jgi:hypothetical protein